jgi:hypothetical protein
MRYFISLLILTMNARMQKKTAGIIAFVSGEANLYTLSASSTYNIPSDRSRTYLMIQMWVHRTALTLM